MLLQVHAAEGSVGLPVSVRRFPQYLWMWCFNYIVTYLFKGNSQLVTFPYSPIPLALLKAHTQIHTHNEVCRADEKSQPMFSEAFPSAGCGAVRKHHSLPWQHRHQTKPKKLLQSCKNTNEANTLAHTDEKGRYGLCSLCVFMQEQFLVSLILPLPLSLTHVQTQGYIHKIKDHHQGPSLVSVVA